MPLFRTPEFSFADSMKKFPESASNALDYESLLGREEKEIIARVRRFSEEHVAPVISDYWEKAEFPFPLLGKFAELGIGGGCLPREYGCQGLSLLSCAMAVVELARVDGSMSTFFLVHSFLAALTIGMLGSEEQKRELLPDMATFAKVGCWALTEPSHGSDASHLLSTARKVSGGWVLNGRKRWIGNGTFADIVVVFARNEDTQDINAFLVRRGNPGLKTTKIENKIALRCVQNADIELTDAFIPESDRLSGLNSFKDVNKVLAVSRIMVAWQPVGLAVGVYDMCVRYTKQRSQFETPIAAFQLIQEKMQRILSTTSAMWLMAWRVTQLAEKGVMTHEQASLVKAWTTRQGREVVSLGREILGGNGILSDFLVAKAFCDCEAYYSYEGTYEVNSLVVGRGITGISAIRPKQQTR
ncbi:hypothetical protein M9434_006262 [Picochlorum sp. BPE23]|nr:hypothetical protein M9434_006262 [Picochlorum sp. BPE23]KAI8108919.1 hypothetical protein M9435_005336 [Picochlorum sp. BPE23]